MGDQAFADLKVVEYGQSISAPYCSRLLADFGAEVIKVEPPEGDDSRRNGPFPNDVPHPERSGLFLYLNFNKKGITLNLETRTGVEMLKSLIKEADIFVENNPPSFMEEKGLSYEELSQLNPRLIMTSITPYGWSGPYRDYPAYDININAMSTFCWSAGDADKAPLSMPYPTVDFHGGLDACAATLVALLYRDATGEGQHVDISIVDVITLRHTGTYIGHALYSIPGPGVAKRGRRGISYPEGHKRCADGYITTHAPQVAQWIRFLEAMGTPEWTKEPRYRDRRAMAQDYPEEVDALLAPWLMAHTKEEIFKLCREFHVPFAPVRTVDEVVNDPHLKERQFFVELEREDLGAVKIPFIPFKSSETPAEISHPPPFLGQHNEEIFCGRLGLTREQLSELARTGVI